MKLQFLAQALTDCLFHNGILVTVILGVNAPLALKVTTAKVFPLSDPLLLKSLKTRTMIAVKEACQPLESFALSSFSIC